MNLQLHKKTEPNKNDIFVTEKRIPILCNMFFKAYIIVSEDRTIKTSIHVIACVCRLFLYFFIELGDMDTHMD